MSKPDSTSTHYPDPKAAEQVEHRTLSIPVDNEPGVLARVIDATTESFIFDLTGKSDKIDQFVLLMQPLGLVEVSRSGIVAIARGAEGM